MLIDEWLPTFHYKSFHSIKCNANADVVYRSIQTTDFSRSFILKMLFYLRGLRTNVHTLKEIDKMGFVKLDEKENEEIVYGTLTNSATFSDCRETFNPSEFKNSSAFIKLL